MTNERPTCTAVRWLSIVGIGEDGVAGLAPVAQKLIASAELVVGGKRHLGLADGLIRGRRLAWPNPIGAALPEIEKHRGRPVVVLASGDPFHYGVGDLLLRSIPAAETLCLPQSSAFSLAASRLGWSLQDVTTVSLHGRALEGIVRHLQPGARILALSWDGETPSKLAKLLVERGMGNSSIIVLEAMGGPRERVRRATAKDFDLGEIAPLNAIALEVVASPDSTVLGFAPGLDDTLFEHDGQLTKREVRAVTLSALPPPDAVFIGGGLSDPGVFDAAWAALKSGGRLVANAVSLQSEARLIEYFQRHGGELVRLEVAKAGKAGTGGVFVWRPAAPIIQWRARKP